MALTVRRPLLAVASLRLVLVLLSGLPGLVAAGIPLKRAFADPWFADAGVPLPAMQLAGLLSRAGGAALGGILAGTAFLFLVHQAFVAGAITALLPPGPWRTPPRGWRGILAAGAPWTWAMLRVTLLAAALAVAGLVGLKLGFGRLVEAGDARGWTAMTLHGVLGPLRALLSLAWLSLVGAGALLARAIVVRRADARVRAAILPALRAWRRAPLRAALLPAGMLALGFVLGGVPVIAWRLVPPAGAAGLAGWLLLALLGLAAQAALWTAAVAGITRAAASR